MIPAAESEIEFVLSFYRVGRLVDYQRNERGYVNTSFAIETELHGRREMYFLRRYKTGVTADEIQFEHSIIQHLLAKGIKLVAPVIETKAGETFLSRQSESEDTLVYYALFKFLSGEDRYTWVDPRCSQSELVNAAIVLAQFHQAVADLQPRGRKTEPKIFELLRSIPAHLEACLTSRKDATIGSYLQEHADLISGHINRTRVEINQYDCRICPQIVIHCDFHPGNLQFTGSQVTGLFDFDWSKIDLRCFDVGLALFYFFASWDGDQDGHLRLEEAGLFLQSYQAAFVSPGGIGPLSSEELDCLPAMIRAGNLYVLSWALMECFNKETDSAEYLVYFRHAVNTVQWLEAEANLARLQAFLR